MYLGMSSLGCVKVRIKRLNDLRTVAMTTLVPQMYMASSAPASSVE